MTPDPLLTVARGFRLAAAAFRVLMVGILVGIVGFFAAGGFLAGGLMCCVFPAAGGGVNPGFQAAGDAVRFTFYGVAGLVVLGGVVGLTGRRYCLAVPDRVAGARRLTAGALGLGLLAMAAGLVYLADLVGGNFLGPEGQAAATWVTLGGWVLGDLLFILFGRAVAAAVGRDDLAGEARLVFWLWVVAVVCAAAAGPVLSVLQAQGVAAPRIAVTTPALVCGLVGVSRYETLLRKLAPAVREGVAEAGAVTEDGAPADW